MTTDDNVELSTENIEPTTEQPTVDEPTSTIIDDKINEMLSKMNEKFDAILKQHEQETKELKDEINSKNEEIKRLENVNKAIIMSTNVEKSTADIDFDSVDFDDVDWNKEVNMHMKQIDSKIF